MCVLVCELVGEWVGVVVCCLRYIFWANNFRERGLELLVANSLTQCVLVFCILCIVSPD